MTAERWPNADPAAFDDERVIADPEPSRAEWERQFHLIEDGGCGQAWNAHDNSDPQATLPFGCLPELVARANAGDQ